MEELTKPQLEILKYAISGSACETPKYSSNSSAAAMADMKHQQQSACRPAISIDQAAYEQYITVNPKAYGEGDWVVWQNAVQVRHFPASEKLSFFQVLKGLQGPCYCNRHYANPIKPTLDASAAAPALVCDVKSEQCSSSSGSGSKDQKFEVWRIYESIVPNNAYKINRDAIWKTKLVKSFDTLDEAKKCLKEMVKTDVLTSGDFNSCCSPTTNKDEFLERYCFPKTQKEVKVYLESYFRKQRFFIGKPSKELKTAIAEADGITIVRKFAN